MNAVSGVLYHSSLVNKIQKRLVRVIVSRTEKAKYEKRFPSAVAVKPSLEDFLSSAKHNIYIYIYIWMGPVLGA